MFVRFRFTLILVLLNIITVGLLLLINYQKEENQIFVQDWDIALFANTATNFSLQGNTLEKQRVLKKKGNQWWIEKPVLWRANQHAVHQILNQLKFLEIEVHFSLKEMRQGGRNLAEYGLDNPDFSIVFGDQSNSIELSFGKPSEVGNRIYILSPDKKDILVAKQDIVKSLIMPLSDLIEDDIFMEPIYSVNELTVEKGQDQIQRTRLEKRNESWKFSMPFEDQVDPNKIKYFLNDIYALKLRDFVFEESTDSIRSSFENPQLRLVIGGEEKQEILLVGKEVVSKKYPSRTNYYAKRKDLDEIFIISNKVFELVEDMENQLRNKLLIDFDEKYLQRLVVKNQRTQITIQKQKNTLLEQTDKWYLMENLKDQPISVEPVDRDIFNHKIAYLKKIFIKSFVTDTPTSDELQEFGLKDFSQQITLVGDGYKGISIIIGNILTDKNHVYVKRNDSDSIFAIDNEILLKLTTDRLDYLDRNLFKLNPDDTLSSIKIRKYGEEIAKFQTNKDDNQTWEDYFENNPPEIDTKDLKILLHFGRNFIVRTYMKNSVNPNGFSFGDLQYPWKWVLEYSIKPSSGQPYTQSYLLTERIGGILQGGANLESEQEFTLRQELVDALFPFIFERSVISVEEALTIPKVQ